MSSIPIEGHIDDQHRLLAIVPDSLPPGPVTVWIASHGDEDDAGRAWTTGIARQWVDDLGDAQQDIYTLADGEALGPA